MSDNSNTALQSYIDRLVNLCGERRLISESIGDLRREAASNGFDGDALTEIVKRVLMDEDRVARAKQRDEIARVYAETLGQGSLF